MFSVRSSRAPARVPCTVEQDTKNSLSVEEGRKRTMQTSKNGRTILVGEDEMEVRGYLEMALKCLGYSVELAQDGDEVLVLPASRPDPTISAVLLDIMMPNRDGIETLREIRAPGYESAGDHGFGRLLHAQCGHRDEERGHRFSL